MRSLPIVLLAALVAGAFAQQSAEKMGIWVPLYVLPRYGNETKDDYNRLIESVENDPCLANSFHGTVFTGPYSKPPNVTDEWERNFFRERYGVVANTTQWTTFGYVSTLWGNRSFEDIKADIDVWANPNPLLGFGDQVQGIWVDGVWNKFNVNNGTNGIERDYAKWYGDIAAYVKGSGKIVAFNPGALIDDCAFLKTAGVEFVNNFEDYYSVWQTKKNNSAIDCKCKDAVRCIASIHGWPAAATAADLQEAMTTLKAKGYSAVFLTDRELPNHYLSLPSFWANVVAGACEVTVAGGNNTSPAPTSPAPDASPSPTPPVRKLLRI